MRAIAVLGWQEEIRIELQATAGSDVALHHPAFDAGGIELTVPGSRESIGEVDTPTIAAHLHHLRSAVNRPGGRVRRALDDAAEAHGAGELRIVRVRYVILTHLARAPAGNIEEAVIEREVDVGDQRRHRLEGL